MSPTLRDVMLVDVQRLLRSALVVFQVSFIIIIIIIIIITDIYGG